VLDSSICAKCRYENGIIRRDLPPRQWGCPAKWKNYRIGGGEIRISSQPPKGCRYALEQGMFTVIGNK
jgi:hypothetical protein